jgi:flagellar motor component MotA
MTPLLAQSAAPPADWPGAIPVVLAVLAASAVAMVAARLLRLDHVLRSMLAHDDADRAALMRQLRLLAEAAQRTGPYALADLAPSIRNRFLSRAVRLAATADSPETLKATLDRDLERALVWHQRRAATATVFSAAATLAAPVVIGVSIAALIRAGPTQAALTAPVAGAILGLVWLSFLLLSVRRPARSAAARIADHAMTRVLITSALVAIRRGLSPEQVEDHLRAMLAAPPRQVPHRVAA